MELNGAEYIFFLLARADIFMLIFIRFIGFMVISPVFGIRNIPAMTKVGFSVLLSLLVFTSGNIESVTLEDSIIGYFLVMIKEFFVGVSIGYVVFLIFNIMYLAGFLSDQQIGLTMANVFDPVSMIQVPISGNLYYLIMCAFLVAAGAHRMLISSVFYSFEALPIGSAVVVGNSNIFAVIIELMSHFFSVGVLVALPVTGVMLVLDVALGIMARAVPKMNIFAVGMSVKVLIGLSVVWIISPMLSMVYDMLYKLITQGLVDIIKVMMP